MYAATAAGCGEFDEAEAAWWNDCYRAALAAQAAASQVADRYAHQMLSDEEEAASPGIKHSVCSPQKGTAMLQVAREDAAAKTAPDATGRTREPDTREPEVASPVGVVGLALARAGNALAQASGSSGPQLR